MNYVSEPINNAHVKHSMRNAKFESICAIYNKCLFDANHDMCVIEYVNDVNVRSKFKSKRNKKRKVWKTTGKVFNEIGYSWKPTSRTFTIVKNKCPLTRFTFTKVVPTKKTTNKYVLTPTQGVIVYSRRPKAPKLVGSSSKYKITESRISNFSNPTQSGGSTVSDIPYSSLNDCRKFLGTVRFGNEHIAKIMGYGDYQMGDVTISWVYYVEGLGHNLFSVGQFCDSDLELLINQVPIVIAPEHAVSTGTPSSMTIDQDAPSTFRTLDNNPRSFGSEGLSSGKKDRLRGIFRSYVKIVFSNGILREEVYYDMETYDPMDTPTVEKSKLDKDPQEKAVDPTPGIRQSLRKALICDVDHAVCQDTRKSTSGSRCIYLGDRLVSWRKEHGIALQYRHIDIRHHFIMEQVENGVVEMCFVQNEIMNPQETQQVVARDEKWVSSTERVKISSTNAFTITAEVLEIFMQQFWYTIKKVKDSESYEFLLDNKKCIVDAEVFRKILDICPRVEGEEFTEVQDDDATLTFLTDLCFKGPLHKYTNMYVDHMHQPWRTLAAIINKCLSGKTASNDRLRKSRIDILSENQDVKLRHSSDSLKSSSITSSHNTSLSPTSSFSTIIQLRMMKSRGKGSQRKKTADTPMANVDVSEESDSEPARKRTASKSINLTEAIEEEAARQVHATHARIPKPATSKLKLKGVQSLTPEEQEDADIMQALKESKKTSRRQPGTRSLNKGTSVLPGVPDESTVVLATSSEGTSTKPGVLDEENVTSEEKVILEWGSEQESEYSKEDQGDDKEVDWIDFDEDEEKKDDDDDDKSINLEKTNDEETKDEFVHSGENVQTDDKETDDAFVQGDEQVNDDEDEEMTNAEVEDSRKGDAGISDVAKANAEKIKEIKDDAKKAELPPTSSSLSMLRSTRCWISKIQYEVPHIQSPSVLTVPVSVISEPVVPTPIPITPLVAPVTTLLTHSSVSTIPPLRVAKLEKDVSELKKINHSAKALATLKSQVPTPAPESSKIQKPTIDLEQEYQKSASKIRKIKREQAERQKMPKTPANHALYHALMEALIEDENAMDKGVADTVKNHKSQHDDDDDNADEDPSAGPNQGKKTKRRRTKETESSKKPPTTKETPKGKAQSKGSKTAKSAFAKEPIKEPIIEVVIDNVFNTAGEDVVRDNDQPQDTSKPKTNKTPNQDWFKQPPRPPIHDPEWNKRQVVLDQPK
ncbi:retrovirus-related pol polyprotein from transposon TNT 1-94 [Tanacetum coccineum]|uniref:Retrovirus-related pol polyprotein from transposon TNT 1-94 n=1 Tax=Tanacetum coccineum TaxID=301880 RepID=A0ABQ5GB16_9ASTR